MLQTHLSNAEWGIFDSPNEDAKVIIFQDPQTAHQFVIPLTMDRVNQLVADIRGEKVPDLMVAHNKLHVVGGE